MRIRLAIPDELDDQDRKEALNAALEAVTISNAAQIRNGTAPKITPLIKSGAVRWKPEPPGDEHFDGVGLVASRRWGDCDDLAPAYAGQLRATGADEHARAFVRRSGPNRWHALVRRGDGTIEDPSRAAGMGATVNGIDPGGTAAPIHRPMTMDPMLSIALRSSPNRRHWFARVDLPDGHEPWSWTSIARHPDPKHALLHSMKNARTVVGDDIDEMDEYRLSVMNDLVLGADPYEVAQALYGMADDNVDVMRVVLDGVESVGFLDSLTRGISHALGPIARSVARVVRPVAKFAAPALSIIPGAGMYGKGLEALASGDPMKMAAATMPEGSTAANLIHAKEVLSTNPALRGMVQKFSPLFGGATGMILGPLGPMAIHEMSDFIAPTQVPPQAQQALAQLQAGAVPPELAQNFQVPGIPPEVMQMLSMLHGINGNAPPASGWERGAVAVPHDDGPAYMRF